MLIKHVKGEQLNEYKLLFITMYPTNFVSTLYAELKIIGDYTW